MGRGGAGSAMVQLLVACRADPNDQARDGNTPLHLASSKNSVAVLVALVNVRLLRKLRAAVTPDGGCRMRGLSEPQVAFLARMTL